GGEAVGAELPAQWHARGAVALRVNARKAAVLADHGAPTLPGDDEVAVQIHGHRRGELGVGGEGIDPELATQPRPGRVEALREDVGGDARSISLPGDDEA